MGAHSAKHHMVTEICTGKEDETVQQYLQKIRAHRGPLKNLSYIYITDTKGVLCGVISNDELLRSQPDAKLADICTRDIVSVSPDMDQEQIAIQAIHKRLKAIPVVDEKKRLLGAIPSYEILHILHQEHIEDFLRAAGIRHGKGSFTDVLRARTFDLLKARVPWLIVGLIGGMFATFITTLFEKHLHEEIILAFFIPIIVYMADAVATQSESLFIRSLTLSPFTLGKYLARELIIGSAIGLICGTIILLFSLMVFQKVNVSFIIAIAMFVTIATAVIPATLIPWALVKLKKDPAVGSGPFATIIQDIFSLFIYFVVASMIL